MLEDTNDSEMNDLRMSAEGRVLYDQVKRFVAEEVDPITEEFFKLGEGREVASVMPFLSILRIEDGLVVSHRDYADYAPFLAAARAPRNGEGG